MREGAVLRQRYDRELERRGYRPDAAQLAAVDELERLRTELIGRERSRASLRGLVLRAFARTERHIQGVYLCGGVGRGKTFIMDLFQESLPFGRKRRTHFHRFMHDVHAQLASSGGTRDPLAMIAERIARDTAVLCFDELYVSDIADAMLLAGLFGGLIERGVALVFTSNLPPRELYRDGLQRQRFLPAIALLESSTTLVRMDGPTDYRLRRLEQASLYLPADADASHARLAALFETLGDSPGSGPCEVLVAGRRLRAVRESAHAVWFDFAALCEGPRSQDDYIEIARDYQSVILERVPVLDHRSDDAARRFIALVDELYDRGVNLVLSAAAPIGELYRGTRLQREFERTISRIVEMQSAEYLAREHRP